MFAALLVVTATLSQVPVAATIPDGLDPQSVDVRLQATETHFTATSFSEAHQLLYFGLPGTELTSAVLLAPHSEITYRFCRGCLDGLSIEVLRIGRDRWSNTGALTMTDIRDADQGALWVASAGGNASPIALGWTQTDGVLEHAQPEGHLAPAAALRSGRGTRELGNGPASVPFHVPVITPEEGRDDKSKPPVIDKKPLPPV